MPSCQALFEAAAQAAQERVQQVMMIVYWYSFSNHYTRKCIHTCERERKCGSSQSSSGFILAPSSWCRHASHARHLPSPPCLVSSQAGFGMQCYSPPHARWPQCVYRGRVQADPVYPWSSLLAPPRLRGAPAPASSSSFICVFVAQVKKIATERTFFNTLTSEEYAHAYNI